MKLPLLCVFMGLNLVFADRVLHEEPSTQIGVQKRGESYDKCIEAYLSEAVEAFKSEDEITTGAVDEAAEYVRACLSENTDKEATERRQNMVSCVTEAYSELKQAMVEGGKSEDDVSQVIAELKEYQAKAMSYDPKIGCNDNE